MAYQFTLDDVRFLAGEAGRAALATADLLALTETTLLSDLTRLRRSLGDQAGAVAETVRLRRRAAGKLGPAAAASWLFTDEALQQATPAPVAAHRARRLAAVGVHDLTCSIGADLAALLVPAGAARSAAGSGPAVPSAAGSIDIAPPPAGSGPAAPSAAGSPVTEPLRKGPPRGIAGAPARLGSDLDPVRLLMARHNLSSVGVPAPLVRADALNRTSQGLLGYADPARRDGGRRITSVSTLPSVADLDAAHADRPPVLRLPPGIDYDSLGRAGEVEIVSLDGGAREAVLWPAELAEVGRRASVLSSERDSWEVTSDDPDDVGVGPVGDFLIDPDSAVVRAHLVRHYAARHGLWQLDSHLAYLTGAVVPQGVRGFQVLDAAPYREKTVAGWARRDGIGTLEIKQRGTPIVPDELRRRLRPALRGPTAVAATLVVARIGQDAQAFWCRAVAAG